ncbi:MAG TPA: helix-turn-helix transcriptional regulator [Bacillota bacterium]|nr:helix-turn-helix transcriptional regulator [Bacillota bacterium]
MDSNSFINQDELYYLNQMIADLYAEDNKENAFRGFLVNLKKLVFFEKGDVYFYHLGKENFKFNTFIHVDWNENDLNSYLYTYGSMDDVLPLIATKQPIMFRSSDVFIKAEREKTQYYNELINTAGMQHSIEGNIYVGDEGYVGGIGIHRSDAYSDFDQKELEVLRFVRPHLANIAKEFCEAQDEKSDYFSGIPLLKNIQDIGICILDYDLNIVESNFEQNSFLSAQNKEELFKSLLILCESLKDKLIRGENSKSGGNERVKSKVGVGENSYFVDITFSDSDRKEAVKFVAVIYDYGTIISNMMMEINGQYNLTSRESEILQYVMNGYSNQEISRMLYISIPTVKKHLTSIYNKMGITGKSQILNTIL